MAEFTRDRREKPPERKTHKKMERERRGENRDKGRRV